MSDSSAIWHRPFKTLMAQMEGEDLSKLEFATPEWLPIVQGRLIDDIFRRIKFVETSWEDVYFRGFITGWTKGSLIDLENWEKKMDRLRSKLGDIEGKRLEAISADLDSTEFHRLMLGESSDADLDAAHRRMLREYRNALHEYDRNDAVRYYSGLVDGLRGIYNEDGTDYYRAKTRTTIFVTMWLCWPGVFKMKSSENLHRFLAQVHGSNCVGDLGSFQRWLRENKISIGEVGRPRKKPEVVKK